MGDNDSSILKFKKSGNLVVGTVHATNMLDSITVSDFGDEVIKVVQRFPGIHLMLNFENVDFLSSAALTELIRIHEAVQQAHGFVRLCGVSKDIQKVLRITKLDELFNLNPKDDVDTAVQKFKKSAERAEEEKQWANRGQKR